MFLNNYAKKSGAYAQHQKEQGTVSLAYREFRSLFDKYVTSAGNKALDFGTGTGQSRIYLQDSGFDADGVDINFDMLAKAKEIDRDNEDKYQMITNCTIPHRNFKYDLVFSSFVVLEIGNKDEIFNYFSEAYRVMKFDGCFIVLTVNDNFYKYQWKSIDTNYPENIKVKSGDKVKIKLKDVNLELYDFYWTKDDYKILAQNAGFTILEEIEPKGIEEDPIDWISEKEYAPYVIFVMKKTKSLESNNKISIKNGLNINIHKRGIFAEIDRDVNVIKNLVQNYSGIRNISATIRLLMRPGDFWPFHKLKSKEIFKHIEGNDLLIHCINKNGNYFFVYLGQEHDNAVKEFVIPPECWYAEEVCGKNGYALIEAKTMPAFHPDDQEEATKEHLLSLINKDDHIAINIINKLSMGDKSFKKSLLFNKNIENNDNNFINKLNI